MILNCSFYNTKEMSGDVKVKFCVILNLHSVIGQVDLIKIFQ